MIKKLFVLVSLLVLTAIVVSPVSAGMSGTAVSGVQVQNLSTTDDAITVQLYPQAGGSPITISPVAGIPVKALAATNLYMPSYSQVGSGAYSMVISAGQPMGAIARTDWSSTGGAAIYQAVPPGTDVTVPLVLKAYASQTSQITVQNTDTTNAATDVVLALYARGTSGAFKTLPAVTINAGASMTWSMNDAVWGALPNNGVDLGAATGFVGSMRVTSASPLEVVSYIDLAGSRAVAGFSGIPTTSASNTLFCPLIRANYYGDTGIAIVNPNNNAITATISFYSDANSPNKSASPWVQTLPVAANSMALAFQGLNGNSRAAPTSLPGGTQGPTNPTPTNNGFYGVAKIDITAASGTATATAVVNDTKFGTSWSTQTQSTYNCSTAADAGSKFALPLLRRYHLSTQKLTTGIQIQNTGGTTITIHLDVYNWDGTRQSASDPADIQVGPYSSGNYFNGFLTNLPTVPPAAGGYGWYGSGIITITNGTGVVVVSDEGYGPVVTDSANYNGLKIQ